MEKKDVITALATMRQTYPRFYQTMQSSEAAEAVVNIWYEIFKDDDVTLFNRAILTLFQTLEFPPTIADVRKQMSKMVEAYNNEPSAMDEYNAIRKAIKSSTYYSSENFEKLPEIAKKFVGSPMQLKEWATSENFNEDVLRGQFLKQYEVLKERQRCASIVAKLGTEKVKLLEKEK